MGTDLASLFVGRDPELEELRRGLAEAAAGRGRLFVIAGEAGIGKTRLADETAALAVGQGARVLWGRCWESGGAPAYWPWVQALRAYVADIDAGALAAQLGHGAADIAQILPEIRTRLDIAEAPPADEPDQARFQLFDSTTAFLRRAAQQRKLVLLLEDLHAADQPSLLLLQFVARELRSLPLLIVATARPVDEAHAPAVNDILAAVVREGRRLPLSGLTRDDVAQVLDRASVTPPSGETVDAVHSATAGNPLFVTEVLHLLAAGDAAARELHLPGALRTAIRQRLTPLNASTREIMEIAAVIGREFEVSVLDRVWAKRSGEPRREVVLSAIEQARAAGVVRPVANTVARYIFAHVLIRDTLADDLPSAARMAIHREVGEALEELWATNPAPYLAEIAHHFVGAAPAGEIDKAVEYTRRAGDRAVALLAYEEAVQHYERAQEVLALRRGTPPPADEVLRCELLLARGDALWGSGELPHAKEVFRLAAEGARSLAASDRKTAASIAARAALGFGGRQQRAHAVFDEQVVRLLEDALEALGEDDDPLRARVLARLAYALYLQPDSFDRRVQLCREAEAVARRCGDPVTLRWVLNDWRWALWGPDTIDERLRIADELVQLAERANDREMILGEHAWRLVDFLELGDIAAVDAELETYTRIAAELQRPWFQWYVNRFTAMRHLIEGRFDEAERLSEQALNSPKRSQQQDAVLIYGTQLLSIRVQQGRLAELETAVQAYIAQYPAVTIWKYVVPYVYTELGRAAEARSELERLLPNPKAELRNDYTRLQAASYLAETCAFLGDAERAAALYEQLLPYEDRCVVVGYGIACFGSMARYLGMLAMTIGKADRAARHFDRALEVNTRVRAWPAVARTQLDYVTLLVRRDEVARALPMLAAARNTARELGMASLEQRIEAYIDADERLREQSHPAARTDTSAAATAASFLLNGEFWTIGFAGRTFQLKAVLGLMYIAYLLRHPGGEIHVTDLVDIAEGGRTVVDAAGKGQRQGATARSLGDAGEVLDAQAKAEYRRRLTELREELAEAEELNDLGRIDRARDEMEALGEQLAEGVGLGGRHRRVASHVERARVSVTKRIAIAIKKINEHDAALAAYLRGRIKTGTLCGYEPDPGRPVRWEL